MLLIHFFQNIAQQHIVSVGVGMLTIWLKLRGQGVDDGQHLLRRFGLCHVVGVVWLVGKVGNAGAMVEQVVYCDAIGVVYLGVVSVQRLV